MSATIKVFRFPRSRADITDVQLSLVVCSFKSTLVPPDDLISVYVYKLIFYGEACIYDNIESN
jgi:hypothetical protein